MPRRRYGNLRRRFRTSRRRKRRRYGAAGISKASLNRAARKEWRSRKPCVWRPLPIADNCLAKVTFTGTNALTLKSGQWTIGGVAALSNPFEFIFGNQYPPDGYSSFHVASSAGAATTAQSGAAVFNPYMVYLADKYARIRPFASKLTCTITCAQTTPQNITLCIFPQKYSDYKLQNAATAAQWSQIRGVLSSRVFGGGYSQKPMRISAYATTSSMYNIPKRDVRDHSKYAQTLQVSTDPVLSTAIADADLWVWNVFGYHGAESGDDTVQMNWRITYYTTCDEKRKDYA